MILLRLGTIARTAEALDHRVNGSRDRARRIGALSKGRDGVASLGGLVAEISNGAIAT
jgi:hypothetical protein